MESGCHSSVDPHCYFTIVTLEAMKTTHLHHQVLCSQEARSGVALSQVSVRWCRASAPPRTDLLWPPCRLYGGTLFFLSHWQHSGSLPWWCCGIWWCLYWVCVLCSHLTSIFKSKIGNNNDNVSHVSLQNKGTKKTENDLCPVIHFKIGAPFSAQYLNENHVLSVSSLCAVGSRIMNESQHERESRPDSSLSEY